MNAVTRVMEKETAVRMKKEGKKPPLEWHDGEWKWFSEVEELENGMILYYVDPYLPEVLEATYYEYGMGYHREPIEHTVMRHSRREAVHVRVPYGCGFLNSSSPYTHLYKSKKEAEERHKNVVVWRKIRERYSTPNSFLNPLFTAWKSYKQSEKELEEMLEAAFSCFGGTHTSDEWIRSLYKAWERKNSAKHNHHLVFKDLIFESFHVNIDGNERGQTQCRYTSVTRGLKS